MILFLASFSLLTMLSQDQVSEPIPGLLCPERVEVAGGRISVGADRSEAIAVLGAGVIHKQKPKLKTRSQLLQEVETLRRLAPMYPQMIRIAEQLALDCGEKCWVEILEKPIGVKDKLRVAVVGPAKESGKVYLLAIDHEGTAMRHWRSEFLTDLRQEAVYFVTDGGTHRVRRMGMVYVIEEIH